MPTVFVNGQQRQYEKGTTFEDIADEFQEEYADGIALVYFNRKMRELNKKVDRDGVLTFITTKDSAGHLAYVRTATLMLVKAVADLTSRSGKGTSSAGGEAESEYRRESRDPAPLQVKVEFTIGDAYYCTLHGDLPQNAAELGLYLSEEGEILADETFTEKVYDAMDMMAERDITISKKTYPIDDALALFRRQNMDDKVRLFRFRRSSTINVYNLDGYCDYFYGYMFPSTGYVKLFDVMPYEGGILLNLPGRSHPEELTEFEDQPNLFDQLMLSTEWGDLVDIETVGDLNEQICSGNISDMILVQEALQERRIGDIAEQIFDEEEARVVLVAGPSSSGKTTFAHRLAVQLRSFGLRPHILSMDNWFLPRERTPIDEDGNYDFEVLEALDLELFNENMVDLLSGETVELPTFDFKSGKRRYRGNKMTMGPDDILIIEGIHGLNPKTSEEIPAENKFKIYTSALTSLNIDAHNRISSSDTRLLRRIVRDARTRGTTARETIAQWKKVREGEEKYIFPYQQEVDAVFNSVLIYEQAVLKQFAEPQLYSIPTDCPEYYEAKRLLKFLEYFVGVDTAVIPANSICREFVGGGCFTM